MGAMVGAFLGGLMQSRGALKKSVRDDLRSLLARLWVETSELSDLHALQMAKVAQRAKAAREATGTSAERDIAERLEEEADHLREDAEYLTHILAKTKAANETLAILRIVCPKVTKQAAELVRASTTWKAPPPPNVVWRNPDLEAAREAYERVARRLLVVRP